MARSAVRDLTVGSPMKLVLGFATPLLFGFIFQQLYNIVDTAIVGQFLGANALAAVGSTGSINFLILGFCMGICSGFSIPIAQSFGAREESEMRRYVVNSAYLSGVFGVILAVLTGFLCPQMLQWMNTPADIIDDAVAYIQIIFFGIPATMLYNMTGGILRALGDSKTPVYFLVVASIVNIVLDLTLILVVPMGVAGAAIATVVSQIVSGVGCLIVMKKRFPILHCTADERRFRSLHARKLTNIGIPMGLQYSITAIGSVVVQVAVNGLGTVAVAAVSAAGRLNNFFCCIFDALATTMATFAGQNIGARKVRRINEGLKDSSILGIIYCVLAFVIIYFFGKPMIGLFVSASDANAASVTDLAQEYMVISAAFYIPLLFVNIVRLSIQGMGYTQIAVCAGICEMIARTLVGWLLVPIFGYTAACYASPVAWLAADAFLFPCYFSIIKKLKKRLGDHE
jgi:Na+-driven multidrug efflux pump